jgi:RNA polymerase sigma-70 factor (ECF subfamily)
MFALPAAGPAPADAALVREIAAGSEPALAALYYRHAAGLYRVALGVTGDRQVAEEVVQETFLALWNRAERFDPALGELAAWLSVIARNRARDRQRAARRRIPAGAFSDLVGDAPDEGGMLDWLVAAGEPLAVGSVEASPELLVLDAEAATRMAELVAGLPDSERDVLVLAYGEGLTQSEIAARLGWPIGTVKTRTRRALARLRHSLEPALEPVERKPAPGRTA